MFNENEGIKESGEETNTSNPQQIETKEEERAREKAELLNRVVSGKIEGMRDRVAFILNNSNEARNSDIELLWSYWKWFDKFSGTSVSKEEMSNLARISSLSRMRAKIQNEYKLFQADAEVQRFRGMLEDDKRVEAIEDKPTGLGMYSVYIDESGKTQDFLSVGSLWVLKFEISIVNANQELLKWKKEKEINYEFHFNELTRNKMSFFQEFVIKFLVLFPEAGFKLIVINNKGFTDNNQAITDLTYHLISRGIQHENETGRAPLPRLLQVWLDEEEKGSDQLKIENIKERLTRQKIEGLYLGDFQTVSSKGNFYIQIIDLFTASINRKLNTPDGNNFKDEFADFVLSALKFDVNKINKENTEIDQSKLFNLTIAT